MAKIPKASCNCMRSFALGSSHSHRIHWRLDALRQPSKIRVGRGTHRIQANIFEDFENWKEERKKKARIERLAARDKRENFWATVKEQPIVAAYMRFWNVIRDFLDPLIRLINAVKYHISEFLSGFDEFALEECKRQWNWRRETRAELLFWMHFLEFCGGALATHRSIIRFVALS